MGAIGADRTVRLGQFEQSAAECGTDGTLTVGIGWSQHCRRQRRQAGACGIVVATVVQRYGRCRLSKDIRCDRRRQTNYVSESRSGHEGFSAGATGTVKMAMRLVLCSRKMVKAVPCVSRLSPIFGATENCTLHRLHYITQPLHRFPGS